MSRINPEGTELVRIGFEIDRNLKRRLLIQLAEEERTLTQWFISQIEVYLAERRIEVDLAQSTLFEEEGG